MSIMELSSSEIKFFKDNGYLIKKIIPIDKIKALQQLLANMIRNSYTKNVKKIGKKCFRKRNFNKCLY